MGDYYDDYDYDQDGGDNEEVSVENEFYNAKGKEEDGNLDEAIEDFDKVIDAEEEQGEKGEWGFKSLKHIVKICFKQKQFKEMMKRYKVLLTYIKSAVTRNMSDKSINSLLEMVSGAQNPDLLLEFYQTTLGAAKEVKNERLWFKTNMKLAYTFVAKHDFEKATNILQELHHSCQIDGVDDPKKATSLVEIYALYIQVYNEQNDFGKMAQMYSRVLTVKNAAPSAMVNGVIREAGGKVDAKNGGWANAYRSFFDGFHSYDEAGHARRLLCLKYLVLANMMQLSNINPFESQETRPYKELPEIAPMVTLVAAYQKHDIEGFQKILSTHRSAIFDSFMDEFVPQLFVNIRTQLLIKLIGPYTAVHIPFLATTLNVTESEVESMVVSLVLDRFIEAKIDQIQRRLLVKARSQAVARKYDKLQHWSSQLSTFQRLITSKVG